MNSLSPAQCYRAGTSNGKNRVFVVSEEEEKRLESDGRIKGKMIMDSISRTRSTSSSPERRLKRNRL